MCVRERERGREGDNEGLVFFEGIFPRCSNLFFVAAAALSKTFWCVNVAENIENFLSQFLRTSLREYYSNYSEHNL